MCTLNTIEQTLFRTTEIAETTSARPAINFAQHVPVVTEVSKESWHERAVAQIKTYKYHLDEIILNYTVQDYIDDLGRTIREKFAPFAEFNRKLDSAVSGPWYNQLLIFLVKLPIRTARNIVNLLYAVVKSALYAAVHPMKAVLKLAKFLILFANELSKPETWPKIGVGMIGSGLAQSLVTGNAVSLIGIAIGIAMTIGGITASCLKTAIEAENGNRAAAVKENLLACAQELAESALTGFCLGLIMGIIQRAQMQTYQQTQRHTYSVSSFDEAKQYVDQLIEEHQLPPYRGMEVDQSGTIHVAWYIRPGEGTVIEGVNIPFIGIPVSHHPPIEIGTKGYVHIALSPTGSFVSGDIMYNDSIIKAFSDTSLKALGIPGNHIYPLPPNTLPPNTALMKNVGQVIGASHVCIEPISSD